MVSKPKKPKSILAPKKPKHRKPNVRHKKRVLKPKFKLISQRMLLLYLGFVLIVFALWFMYQSVNLTKSVYEASISDSNSFLAYDKSQIKTAKIVGTKVQLKNEIKNYNWAPADLQKFMLNDYKSIKKNCVVNGSLVGEVSYRLLSIEYDKYATVMRGCNGEQKSVLAKFSNNWIVIFSGNTTISCSVINDYDIPKIVSPICETNGVLYLNPNP
jgi:hypothetical protein